MELKTKEGQTPLILVEKNQKETKGDITKNRIKKVVIFSIAFFAILLFGAYLSTKSVGSYSIPLNDGALRETDIAFMILSTILVMVMTPALALFYGGMVRKKNILGTLMQSFISLGVVSIIWMLYGYSLAFSGDIGHLIGNFNWVALKSVALNPGIYATTIPHQLFMAFQMMFACLTPALITGAFAERFKFKSFLLFLVLWVTFVYCPLAHWVWGDGGWINNLGGLDFAGGLVVHIASGASALACCLMLGKRKGYKKESMPPHNLTLTFVGTMLLWFGWFGFNAGSALTAGTLATTALVTTQLGAAAGMLAWVGTEFLHRRKPTVLGALSGSVAGLVGITPACGFVSPVSAIVIGFLAGMVCYLFTTFKSKFNYDDTLDVVGIHGIGGIVGSVLTGVFASLLINPDGANGLIFGGAHLLKVQIISTIACVLFAFLATLVILKIIDLTLGLRVSEIQEMQGLDISQHGENCYRL